MWTTEGGGRRRNEGGDGDCDKGADRGCLGSGYGHFCLSSTMGRTNPEDRISTGQILHFRRGGGRTFQVGLAARHSVHRFAIEKGTDWHPILGKIADWHQILGRIAVDGSFLVHGLYFCKRPRLWIFRELGI